jgi:cytoskeletal protein CcmA (bactofilin family)
MGLFGFGDSRPMGRVDSIIGPDASLRGNYNSKNSVHVDGEIYGNLTCEESVIVGEKGMIRGNLVGRTILVGGKIKGNITATERVELQMTSHVEGDISTPRLLIEEGAVYEGNCQMEDAIKVVDMPKAARE